MNLRIKASSTGLNLIMANHVFIIDPWWNVTKLIIILVSYRGISNRKSPQNWVNLISVCQEIPM